MSDFQKYLDESLPKVNISEFSNSDPEPLQYDLYAEIQEMITKERKKQKITQKELSKKTGLSQANISNIENGITCPTVDSLLKIAAALGKRLIVTFEEMGRNII
ncbi:MAG: helix-turn-helix transcriptional regulator [Spirochaetales bacterium]|nr:helix-turn-helix transcriptional regulator [Spirochaetales bacterium]